MEYQTPYQQTLQNRNKQIFDEYNALIKQYGNSVPKTVLIQQIAAKYNIFSNNTIYRIIKSFKSHSL